METETKANTLTSLDILMASNGWTLEDVRDMVQQAYDQHSILATPDWHAEALAAEQAGLAAFQEPATPRRPYCPCGQPGCSDALQAAHNSGVRA